MAFILTKDHSTNHYSKLKRGCALNQSIGNTMSQICVRFPLFFFFSTGANFPTTLPLLWRDFPLDCLQWCRATPFGTDP
jgi:hypothetical protein